MKNLIVSEAQAKMLKSYEEETGSSVLSEAQARKIQLCAEDYSEDDERDSDDVEVPADFHFFRIKR